MFRKIILMSCLALITGTTFAQKSNVRKASSNVNTAIEARALQDIAKETTALQTAKAAIDEATKHEKTMNDAKTWLTMTEVLINMNHNESMKSDQNAIEAKKALEKAVSLDKKTINDPNYAQLKFQLSIDFYNIAVKAYQNSDYSEAYDQFGNISTVLEEERSNMYKDFPMVDTVRAQSSLLQAYSGFYANKNKEAISIFEKAKKDPIINTDPNIYYVLAEAYQKEGNEKKMLATIEEGRKNFPDNENLSRLELNYYLESGNEQKMVQKLQEAIDNNPADPELVFNLGVVYAGMAENSEGAKKEEYIKKSETSYKKALQLDPQDGKFNYQLGAFYFNKAAQVNTDMQKLGYSEQKKYEEMEKERNKIFETAIPFLETSRGIYQRNSRNLSHNDTIFYRQTLVALSNIYSTLNEMDKVNQVRDELDAL